MNLCVRHHEPDDDGPARAAVATITIQPRILASAPDAPALSGPLPSLTVYVCLDCLRESAVYMMAQPEPLTRSLFGPLRDD